MKKVIFLFIEIIFAIILAAISELAAGSDPAYFIGLVLGNLVLVMGVPYLWVLIFARKNPAFHTKAFIISCILFVLYLIAQYYDI